MSVKRPAWMERNRAPVTLNPARTHPDVADQALREFGAAPPALTDRSQYSTVLPDGRRVALRTSRSPENAEAALARKADLVERFGDDFDMAAVWQRESLMERHLTAMGVSPDALQAPATPLVSESNVMPANPWALPPGWPVPPGWPAPDQPYAVAPAAQPAYAIARASRKLSETIPGFLDWLEQKGSCRSIITEAIFSLRVFYEIVGDIPVTDLGLNDTDKYLQAIRFWPPHASKKRAFRNMRAPEVVAKARRLNAKTINRRTQQIYIQRLRTFFRYLENRNELAPGLLKGVTVWRPQDDPGGHRHAFTEDQLKLIFDPARAATFRTPYMYWVPMLALYQGMRLTEIAQLYLDDIELDSPTPTVFISPDREGQRIKTRLARRTLPIHPVILENGFAAFIAQCKRWKRTTVFPETKWIHSGPGNAISDWFNATYLRKQLGIVDPKLTFHSLRHNFATYADQGNMPHERLAKMMGHAGRQEMLQLFYFGGRPAEHAQMDILSIDFPKLDHVPYDPKQFEAAFERAQAKEARAARMDGIYGETSGSLVGMGRAG